ncbi:MAG: acetylxylan esterase [Undibacterium sp.]|nr:acetylxylan esterase [Opitutaceae bacterium]
MNPTTPAASLTRRQLLRVAGLGALGVAALERVALPTANAADDAEPRTPARGSSALTPQNRFPRMMQDYLVGLVTAVEDATEQKRAGLRSAADAQAYAAAAREKIARCFGALPEKTPLNARTTAAFERDTYRVENVLFESRPGFVVTANLYLPKHVTSPAPAVLGACGHSDVGKAGPTYQSFAQGLVRQGYVVLVFDPIGLGERFQYVNAEHKPLKGTAGVREHLQAGNQQLLVGENFAAWNLWDGMRALDYLLTRPEVDPRHVGVTGSSGGGAMTAWLCALEPRLTMAAPSCFVSTFRRNAENELPVDSEQCPPRALAEGLDHADFFAPFAPRPLQILGQEQDFFDARGFEAAGARLRAFYRLLGAELAFAQSLAGTVHSYSQENREAMYRGFNAATGKPRLAAEPAVTLEKPETLFAAPSGRVSKLDSKTVFAFTRGRSQALAAQRGTVTGDALRSAVRALLRLPERRGAPEFRILRASYNRNYPKKYATDYAVATEPPVFTVVYRLGDARLLSRPTRGSKRATLYVAHRSADAELREETLIREAVAAEPDVPFFACDVRGIGESQPNTCGQDFDHPYGSDYFYASHGVMLDRPYVGQKTHDVLRVIDWLVSCGHGDIHLIARGRGTIPATFAALLSPQVVKVTLKHALSSYAIVAESAEYAWPLSTFLPDVLRHFDLPDCYRVLEKKGLRHIGLRDATG